MTPHIINLHPVLNKLYGPDEEDIRNGINRFKKLQDKFKIKFGEPGEHFFSTPGRTEISGNHTDHNHGRVMAASINLDSIGVAALRDDMTVVLWSEGYAKPFKVNLTQRDVQPEDNGTTEGLIRGIAAGFKNNDYQIGGFNACISSSVLPGSGLSSSASIEVLIGTIFSALFNQNRVSAQRLAQIGQYAENQYFGKPCGLMDQMACAVGGIIAIDFKDPENPVVEQVDFDFNKQGYRLLVVDTGGSHVDLTPDYAAVPREMKAVARELGKTVCRELSMSMLIPRISELREKLGDRAVLRAIHFLEENDRVLSQVTALTNGDFEQFIELAGKSGDSSFKWLQNVYSVQNVTEQGIPLALALTEKYISEIGAGACRIHGGGFAGTILVLLPEQAVDKYMDRMNSVIGENRVLNLQIRPYGTIYLNHFLKSI